MVHTTMTWTLIYMMTWEIHILSVAGIGVVAVLLLVQNSVSLNVLTTI